MEHQVHARRDGHAAALRCQACGHQRRVPEGQYDVLNGFLQEHKACVSTDVPEPRP